MSWRRQLTKLIVPALLDDPERLERLLRVLQNPPVKGAAIDLVAGYGTNTVGFAAAASPQAIQWGGLTNVILLANSMLQAGVQAPIPDPWGVAFVFIPNVTAVAASASMTVSVSDQGGNTIGTAVEWAQTAAVSNVGNIIAAAPLRGTNGPNGVTRSYSSTLTASAGTITAAASAGSPIVTIAFSFLG